MVWQGDRRQYSAILHDRVGATGVRPAQVWREWHLRELGTRKLPDPEAGLESG